MRQQTELISEPGFVVVGCCLRQTDNCYIVNIADIANSQLLLEPQHLWQSGSHTARATFSKLKDLYLQLKAEHAAFFLPYP